MAQPIYKVIFQSRNQVYEVYARQFYNSDVWGFIEVEEYVFGERSQLVVDPSEEKLKNEFSGVARSYIPMHAIIRIDEVEREGVGRVTDSKGGFDKVAHLPLPNRAPQDSGDS